MKALPPDSSCKRNTAKVDAAVVSRATARVLAGVDTGSAWVQRGESGDAYAVMAETL